MLRFAQVFKVFLQFQGQIDGISAVLTGEMLLKALLIISVALENSREERPKTF